MTRLWLLLTLPAPALAGTTYTPGANAFGTVLFEDEWPRTGDFDFNDAVLRYNVEQTDDGLGNVSQLLVSLDVAALGASGVCSGLALRLPVAPGALGAVTRAVGTANTGAPWGAETPVEITAAGGHSVLWVADDLRATACPSTTGFVNTRETDPTVACRPLSITIGLTTPQPVAADAPWDLFLHHCGDRTVQTHRPGYYGTPEVDTGLYGDFDDGSDVAPGSGGTTWYVDDVQGIPWALHIGEGGALGDLVDESSWPIERVRVDAAWPGIVAFAGGTGPSNYYESGVAALIYGNTAVPLFTRQVQADLVDLGGGVRGWSDGSYAETCDDYRHPPAFHGYSGFVGNGTYRIDPGTGPFDVPCDMTTEGGGFTVFNHDFVGTTIPDKAIETPSQLYQRLTYVHTDAQISAVVARSTEKRQFFSKQCRDSLINHPYGTSWTEYETIGGGKTQSVVAYFGGAQTPCDLNDATLRTTTTTFVNTPFLPIMALWGGDSGDTGEVSIYTIGPLLAR